MQSFYPSEAKNYEKQNPMFRFTKNYFKPMRSPDYEKRRTTGRDLELKANNGNDLALWQKIFFG